MNPSTSANCRPDTWISFPYFDNKKEEIKYKHEDTVKRNSAS